MLRDEHLLRIAELKDRFYGDEMPVWSWFLIGEKPTSDPAYYAEYIRGCVHRMYEIGTIPVEPSDEAPYGYDSRRWRTMTEDEAAEDIVQAILSTPDVFEVPVWWVARAGWTAPEHW